MPAFAPLLVFISSLSPLSSCEHLPAEATPISGSAFRRNCSHLPILVFACRRFAGCPFPLHSSLFPISCFVPLREHLPLPGPYLLPRAYPFSFDIRARMSEQTNHISRKWNSWEKRRARRSSTVQKIYLLFLCDARPKSVSIQSQRRTSGGGIGDRD